jgi:hypothetical protein
MPRWHNQRQPQWHGNPPEWGVQRYSGRSAPAYAYPQREREAVRRRTIVREYTWHRRVTTSWHIQIHWHQHCENGVCVTNYE